MMSRSGSGPDAVRVDIGRANGAAAIFALLLFGLLAAGGIYASLDTQDTAIRIIGFSVAALFAIPLTLVLRMLPALFRPCGLAFDRSGLHYWEGHDALALPWHEIAAIGIGYEQPPEMPKLNLSVQEAVKRYAADKAKTALKADGKRRIAIEIFPVDPNAIARQTILSRFHLEQAPPQDGLPSARWKVPLPPVVGVASGVERGVRTFQPDRWLGWFARPWSGSLIGR